MKPKVYMQCLLHVLFAGMIFLIFSSNVAFQPGDNQPRDVLSDSTYTYTGWVGNPETLTVYIDDTFSDEEKDSVRVAIQRWNDAGCVPALQEVDEGPANVTVTEGDPGVDPETGIPNAGLYEWGVDDDGKMHDGVITIRNNPNPGLVETATHELGHALGLDDTDPDDNPGDAMKGSGPPNGTNGELSEHDLAEMQAAAAAITPIGEEAPEKVYSMEPNQAIMPGEFTMVSFLLPFDYPPDTESMVEPVANDLIFVEFAELFNNILNVWVFTEPHHWSGQIFFNISLFMFDGEMHQYTGMHYVSQNPVPTVDFECPFNAVVDGNQVLVQWNGLHTYPFDNPLRSTLSVNGNRFYKVNPSADAPPGYYGDYTITLEPGIHELTLVVDDYQVNRASFTMDVVIEEPPPPEPYFALAPDGKTNPDPWYRWISDPECFTPVNFYTNLPDDEIGEVRFYYTHDPTIDWVLFWTDIDGTSNSAPGDPAGESDDHDGWCGYLYHEMLGMIPSELFFKAEVERSDGTLHEIMSELSLSYTLTPPNAFLITTGDGHVIENEYVTDEEQLVLHFTPLHDRFEYAQFQHAALPKDYDKETPHIEQPNNYYCGPAALAMCLKYFAEKSPDQWGHVTGGLSDGALMDSLANRCDTKPPKGTYEKNMKSGVSGWIDKQGGGFKVNGFKKFSDFGKDKLVQHLLHDYQKNNVSQNIISRFMFVTNDNDTLYHYMTLSSVHDKGNGYNRFNYADPAQKPPPEGSTGGNKLKFDLDDEGNASNFTWDDGEEITDFDIKEAKLLSSMMICPNEPAIVSEEGEIAEGPDFPPVEVETPEGSSTGTRVRAVDQDGNKYETDIIIRRPPKTVCPGDVTLPLGGSPHKPAGAQPPGGNYSGPHVDDGWFNPVEEGTFTITYTVSYYGFETYCEFYINVVGYDFGDAPDVPYPTLFANNGARHLISPDLYLGQLVDAEMDGQPCPFALGDDQDGTDDEDGIRFLNSFLPGETVTIEATVHGTGYLNAWFDWEANGSWHDPGNHTIVNELVASGIHTFDITVPDYAATGFTFARFRLTSQSGLSFAGPAPDGEVEDYRIRINETMGHKMHYPQYPDPAGWDVKFNSPVKVADDWICSETGYVEDITFWVSWLDDITPADMNLGFGIEIYSDIPADQNPSGYSTPGTLLWSRDFASGEYEHMLDYVHPQGWFDPLTGVYETWNHENCYRVNINNIQDPFIQEAGTIYWLVITAFITSDIKDEVQIGWKTSPDHFQDVAVWQVLRTSWLRLYDPVTENPLSLAFVISGSPFDPPVPTDFYLAPLGKINPDPWYRWISDPDGVTRVNLLTGYPADQVVSVDFYYSMYVDRSLWTWFYTDTDGTSNAAPGDPETESELNDGWSGYLPHEMLDVGSAELHFKAILTLSELETIEVFAPFTLNYTATPPNAFIIIDENEVLVEDIYYTDQEQLSLFFVPLHDYFGDVMFQTKQELPAEYDKGTPFISQPDSITCGPAAAAMCLKYFAELSPEQYGHIVGEYTDAELVEALSEYFDTKPPKGTNTDKMEKGFKDWIDNHGGGFQTEGFKPFSEFGIEDMVKHLLHDYKQNNVSQNVISRFRIVADDGKVFYHYMTLSSVHDVPGQGYTRFNYMDPADPNDPSDPGIGKVFFDLDVHGNASNITYADGEIITDYAEMKLLESMMICPKEAAILPPPDEGEITENPGSPVEIEIELPQEGSSGLRARATDQDGNKHETDIVIRRTAPATCPGDITVGLGDPPITLAGGTPLGGTYSGPHVVNGVFHPVEMGVFIVTYAVLYPTGFLTDCDFTVTVIGYDFGDAPDDPYPTLLSSDGARHVVGQALYLGQLIDPEPDGQPCPFALGDDQDGNDDEDGIRFLDSFLPGETVRIEATVHGTGYLNAWFDWNANGSWGDPFEHGIVNQPVTTGIHQFNVTVPVNAAPGFTFSRFRLTSQPGLSFQGSAPDGEVEDYRIRIIEPMGHKMHYPQYPDPAGWDVYMPTLYHIYQIGDDWMCSETGYVEDIHFWVSWKEDIVPQNLDIEFHVRIFSDIPAADSYTGYSMPGTLLWQRAFAPGSYVYEEVFEHPQGWLRPIPPNSGYALWDHEICYKVDILNIPDPFLQAEGTVYWLVLSADMSETVPQIGWKTSPDHFNDVAVWYNPPSAWGWQPLLDPITQHGLSLAFVINGSPFTEEPEIPEYFTIDDIIVTAELDTCFNAEKTIFVYNLEVQPGGRADLIAGESIIFYPGTKVHHGGELWARITTDGTFCDYFDKHFLANEPEVDSRPVTLEGEALIIDEVRDQREAFFKLYPNPTRDRFTVELVHYEADMPITIEVYSMLGERILHEMLYAERQHMFSLEGQKPGLYLVRVLQGNRTGIERLILR